MAKKYKSRAQKLKERGKKRPNSASSSQKSYYLQQARDWPLLDCIISKEWRDTSKLTQVIVSRKSPLGTVIVGSFLADRACLGVKNAMVLGLESEHQYRTEYLNTIKTTQPFIYCELDFAAKVVQESIRYGASLGFKPNRDTADAWKVFGDVHPENCLDEIPMGGPNGKPFFVNGPYDDVNRILQVLNRTVGTGNYDFLFMAGDPFEDDEEVEDGEFLTVEIDDEE